MAAASIIPIPARVEIKKILFATDFSDAANAPLPIAAAIARRFGSEMIMAHAYLPMPVFSQAGPHFIEEQKRHAQDSLAQATDSPVLAGLNRRAVVREGYPIEELKTLANAEHVDLIVAGTHGRTGFKHFILGSVAEGIIRTAKCPVLIVGPRVGERFAEQKTISNILVPVDMSMASLSVLPYVMALAAEFKARVHFVHVLPAETGTNPDARRLFAPLKRRMQRELWSELTPSCRAEFLVEFGEEAECIIDTARKVNADLIAMGVHKRLWTTAHIRNTVPYRTIAAANCPVLTVRGKN
jgi:nucleotide-binding universal stress UspA family protein